MVALISAKFNPRTGASRYKGLLLLLLLWLQIMNESKYEVRKEKVRGKYVID